MGKASSAKKIKRVQQAGVSRAAGQRRQFGYPALVGGIIVVGMLLVFFARQSLVSSDEVAPTTSDNWHVAFGVNLCGDFQDPLKNVGKDTTGIHIHDDGLIAVHPKNAESAGTNATFQKFAESVGLTVTDTSITLPDGTTKTNGDKCEDDKEGRVALVVWPPQANDNTEPRVITQNINSTPFTEDGQIFELVFDSRDAKNKLPPTVSKLSDPDTKEPTDTVPAPPTTAPGETTTTVPAETTTTAGG